MTITQIKAFPFEFRLKQAYAIAYDTLEKAPNVLVKIDTDAGITGWGNAAPDFYVTGETLETVVHSVRDIFAPALLGTDPLRIPWVAWRLDQLLVGNSAAKAAINIALYDILGKRAGLPLYQLLGYYRDKMITSVTIGICGLEETVTEAKEIVGRGFKALKVKCGRDWREDIERVKAVRAAVGREIEIRLDANQGYDVNTALKVIQALEREDIEFLEQPTKAEHLHSLKEVTGRSPIPIMADETALSFGDSFRIAANEYADMINVKLMKTGGITGAVKTNAVAEAGGLEVMVGCTDESVVSIAAGLHLALSLKNVLYGDLDGSMDVEQDVATGGFTIQAGYLIPLDRPGLGVEVNL